MPARSVSCAISGENGALSDQPDRERIDHLDLVDRGELGLAERALHGHVALERELRGFGVERLAVMEFHAGRSLMVTVLAVGRGLVRERELRHDVELLVDVEQLVAERGEHDAADIGAADASGSRMSGSSARPMRSVVWACGRAASDVSNADARSAKRIELIALNLCFAAMPGPSPMN